MSLASRIRARFNYLFPPEPPPPKPGPIPPGSSFDPISKLRRRIVVDPIHPDFLRPIDPSWPIPEDSLKNNMAYENSVLRKLHPHTAFGRHGSGMVEIPTTISSSIRALAKGISQMLSG